LEIRVNRLKIIPEAPVNNVQTDAFNAAAAVEHSSGTGPRFSFIIVSYNTLSLTRNAIASICRYAGGAVHEIIVVDNGSTDNSVAVLRGEFPHLRLIELGCNRGFAAANNAGARVARGEWLILLNSDAELLAASLPEVDRLLTQHPQIDVLGAQLLNADGSLQGSVFNERRTFRFEERHQQRELVQVLGIVGAFMVIRHALWQRLGGMDEEYFFYFEEADFCRRATDAGAVVRWSPRVRVTHHRGGSVGRSNSRAQIEYWRGKHLYWRKSRPPVAYRLLCARALLGVLFNFAGNSLLCLLALGRSRKILNRFRSYALILAWHCRGCPAGWGLRPDE